MGDAVVEDPAAGRATNSLAASLHEVKFCDVLLAVEKVDVHEPAVAFLHDFDGSDGFVIGSAWISGSTA